MSTETKSREKKMRPSFELTYAIRSIVDRIRRCHSFLQEEDPYELHVRWETEMFASQEILRVLLQEPSLVTPEAMEAAWLRTPGELLDKIKSALVKGGIKDGLFPQDVVKGCYWSYDALEAAIGADSHTTMQWLRHGVPVEHLERIRMVGKSLGVEAAFEAEIEAEFDAGRPVTLPEPWAALAKKHHGPLGLAASLRISRAALIRRALGQVALSKNDQHWVTEAFSEAGLVIPEGLFGRFTCDTGMCS